MFHACVERFDVIGGRGNILSWDGEVNKAFDDKLTGQVDLVRTDHKRHHADQKSESHKISCSAEKTKIQRMYAWSPEGGRRVDEALEGVAMGAHVEACGQPDRLLVLSTYMQIITISYRQKEPVASCK
jgi:hypothetical protein